MENVYLFNVQMTGPISKFILLFISMRKQNVPAESARKSQIS